MDLKRALVRFVEFLKKVRSTFSKGLSLFAFFSTNREKQIETIVNFDQVYRIFPECLRVPFENEDFHHHSILRAHRSDRTAFPLDL